MVSIKKYSKKIQDIFKTAQVTCGNPKNLDIFENRPYASAKEGGFDWIIIPSKYGCIGSSVDLGPDSKATRIIEENYNNIMNHLNDIKKLNDLPYTPVSKIEKPRVYNDDAYRIFLDKYFTIKLYDSPTGNCQLFTLGEVNTLLDYNKFTIKLFRGVIRAINQITDKRIMHCDLREEHFKRILSYIEPFIDEYKILKYKSTNNSDMVVCLFYLKNMYFTMKDDVKIISKSG